MNIGIDLRMVPYKIKRGWGWYSYNLVSNILDIDKEDIFYLLYVFLRKGSKKYLLPHKDNSYNRMWRFPSSFLEFLWDNLNFPKIEILLFKKVDIFHSLCDFILPSSYALQIVTIHDCVPLILDPQKKFPFTVKFIRNIEKINKIKPRIIITDTENSKKDILKFLQFPSQNIRVVYPGVSNEFKPLDIIDVKSYLKKFGLEYKKYILYVGAADGDKNIEVLIEAFGKMLITHSIPDDIYLVFVGSLNWNYHRLFNLIEGRGIENRCKFLGYVELDELVRIYNGAKVLVIPSLYEGFGLPVVEAIACGTPVILSNTSCFPEVGGDAALYFDPYNSDELIEKIVDLFNMSDLENLLIKRGLENAKRFKWENSATEVIKIYREIYYG